ncbi:hypothetical protein [Nocardioides sp. MH1]
MTALKKYVGTAVAVAAVLLTVGVAAPADAVTSQSGRPIGCC